MSDAEAADAPPHPLQRLTSGGWRMGLLRMGVGLVVVGAAVWLSGEEAWGPLLEARMLPFLAGGAALHLTQRAARMRKWFWMIADTDLIPRPFMWLLRIQLIGLVVNLVLPISEALKAWAVSRTRRDIVLASKSLVADLALHTSLIGGFGVVGLVLVSDANWLSALASVSFALGAVVVMLAIAKFTREQSARLRFVDVPVLWWCLVETLAQLAVYALAVQALGLSVPLSQLLVLAPLLYVSDLVMVTPQGVGLREAVFAATLALLPGATAKTGVAMGLTISAMLLIASAVGGGLGLLLPDREASRARAQHKDG